MTSSNEPQTDDPGETASLDDVAAGVGASGETTGLGSPAEGPDQLPWERVAAARAEGSSPVADPPADGNPPAAWDALNRYISGPGHAGATELPPGFESTISESAPGESYGSELPDLSGPIARMAQAGPTPEGDPDTASSTDTDRPGTGDRESGESRVTVGTRRSRGPMRATMQIRTIDPWSTLKVSLLLSVAMFFVWMIAVAFLYLVLGGMGVWSKLNSNVGDLLTNTGGGAELVSGGTVFGGAILIGLVNIVVMTAMATIGAFIYNAATELIGGIEVTLADRD
ncbi:DUF3566 domain-containing protein [Mycobacterium sp.]|uniref:DUF3566 domain-containing protein n=1 Tax=Mycobacterium sp. TaxID=1785 RepID=UPI003A84E011